MPVRKKGSKAKYHHVRVCDKKRFSPKSFRIIDITEGVKAVIGCKKGQFSKGKCKVGTVVQGLRFDTNVFTPKQAKAWKKRNIKKCTL